MAEFNIINRAESMVDYILTITEKCPKKLRVDIVPEIRKQAFKILEDIVRANQLPITADNGPVSRIAYQHDALWTIRVLESFIEVANRHGYITAHQFNYISKLTHDLFDMIIKWLKSDNLRIGV